MLKEARRDYYDYEATFFQGSAQNFENTFPGYVNILRRRRTRRSGAFGVPSERLKRAESRDGYRAFRDFCQSNSIIRERRSGRKKNIGGK